MYQEELERMIELWEPSNAEVVRTIDTHEDTVERIVKFRELDEKYEDMDQGDTYTYSLYRYFTLNPEPNVHVSVDLSEVDADTIIQHLSERL